MPCHHCCQLEEGHHITVATNLEEACIANMKKEAMHHRYQH